MCRLHILLLVSSFILSSHGAPSPVSPCKSNDDKCMLSAAKNIFAKALIGDKAIGAERLEPLFLDKIDGDLSILKYKMTDTTISGYDKCEIKDFKLDSNKMSFVMTISCPRLNLNGNYEMDGRLIVLPVQGKGKFSLVMDVYEMKVTSSYNIVKDGNGKEHFNIKSYQLEGEPKKGVKFDFQNLFNGKKELANPVQKFVNENWKEVTVFFQGPIVSGSYKKIIKNVNKLLKAMPMERVFL